MNKKERETENFKPGESMAESGEQALVSVSLSVWVAMVLFSPSNSQEYTVVLLGHTSLKMSRDFTRLHVT